MLDHSQ